MSREEALRIVRDAYVSNQLPFGSAMNRHHDVQGETRAHDLVKPLVRLALKSPEHVATFRHAPHAVRPRLSTPLRRTFFSFALLARLSSRAEAMPSSRSMS